MLRELWRGREKPILGNAKWVKVWAKRVASTPSLIGFAYRIGKLRARGAIIGERSLFAPLSLHGKASLLRVGRECFIGRVELHLHDTLVIGDRVAINDGVKIYTASHEINHPNWPVEKKPVYIESHAWIASHAIILPGVRIGEGAVVGAGAVVSKDVPPRALAVGNPARILAERRSPKLCYSPTAFVACLLAWVGTKGMKS